MVVYSIDLLVDQKVEGLLLRCAVQHDFDPVKSDGDEIGTAVAIYVCNLERRWRNADSERVWHLEGTGLIIEKHVEIIAPIVHQYDVGPTVGIYIYRGSLVGLVASVEDEASGKVSVAISEQNQGGGRHGEEPSVEKVGDDNIEMTVVVEVCSVEVKGRTSAGD